MAAKSPIATSIYLFCIDWLSGSALRARARYIEN
jgi:hypothetical protein